MTIRDDARASKASKVSRILGRGNDGSSDTVMEEEGARGTPTVAASSDAVASMAGKSTKRRLDKPARARGGSVKRGKTNVTVIVAPQGQGASSTPPMMPPQGASDAPPMPPMPPMGGPPPGMPPRPPMAPPGAAAMPMRKQGGAVSAADEFREGSRKRSAALKEANDKALSQMKAGQAFTSKIARGENKRALTTMGDRLSAARKQFKSDLASPRSKSADDYTGPGFSPAPTGRNYRTDPATGRNNYFKRGGVPKLVDGAGSGRGRIADGKAEKKFMAKDKAKGRADGGPCWKGYKAAGTKTKGGKSVPDCRPA